MSKKHLRRNTAVNALIRELFAGSVKTTASPTAKVMTAEKIADFTHKSAAFRKDGAVPKMSGDWLVADSPYRWADVIGKPEMAALKAEYKSATVKFGRVMVHVKDLAA